MSRFDVAILGGGIAGMASAARLAAAGYSTVVIEAHGQIGGCAGYYRRRGYSFDVGATTLVDFGPGGVGGELCRSLGLELRTEPLPGYVAHLPDRRITLHRDPAAWQRERLRLGDGPGHLALWRLLDRLADAFWTASRRGVRLPLTSLASLWQAARATPISAWGLSRYLGWTLGDLLRAYGLREQRALVGLLSMLVEDTVHASVDEAPLINAALGITIRGAGLSRAPGGMQGFWRQLGGAYLARGGTIRRGCRALGVGGVEGDFVVDTTRGRFEAAQVVSTLPLPVTATLSPELGAALAPYLRRDQAAQGGALLLCLGVPEAEVLGEPFTHHQLLEDEEAPLGDGNNLFISVSSPGDLESAPTGHRAVMISTHTALGPWQGLSEETYRTKKDVMEARLLRLARRVYPELGRRAVVCELATPRSYARFAHRPQGAVGGTRLRPSNANQHAVPHDVGIPGVHLAGDGTWPGLGTVAGVVASRIIAEQVEARQGLGGGATR